MKQNYFLRISKIIFLFFLALFYSNLTNAQTTLYSQGFETNLDGYSHTPSQTPSSDPGDQYFHRAEPSDSNIYEGSVGPYTNVTDSWLFVGSNPNTINSSNPGILSTGAIDVTGYTDFELSADFGAVPNDWDNSDDLSVEYSWNNTDWFVLYNFGHTNGTNDPLDLTNNATGGNNTANGTTLTYALQTIISNNFSGSGNTLYIRVVCDAGSNYEAFGLDNIILTGISSASETVGFDSGSSSASETDSSFNVNVPVTLSNYGGSQVDLSVTIDGSSTAESGDYTLNTSSLSFTSSSTQNISLDINDDADNNDETVILNIAVSSGTADLGTSQHIITITDDELPNLVINEFQADPDASSGDANGDGSVNTSQDEFIEIYNASGAVLDISDYTINDSSGLRHTFPKGTIIPAGAVIVVFGGGTPTNIPCLTQVASVGYLGLNNGGDTIIIKDDSSTTITSYTYGSEGGDNQSIARGTDLTGSFVKHSTIGGNSVLFSPGRRNADNIPFSKSWTGSSDNDWSNASNWDTNSTPSSVSDNVWISSGASNYPTASGAVTVNSVTINSGASLIAQGTFTGTVTYNRTLASENWYLMSSPVVGETYDNAYVTANGIDSGTQNTNSRGIALYTTSNDSWDYMQAGETATFSAGTGYSIKRSSSGTVSFTGTLNVDNAGVDVVLSSDGNRLNLLGNPYPSHIASATFLTNEAAVSETQTLWVWDEGSGSGAYEVKTLADAMVIAPAQGFFVRANAAGGTFNFSESNQASSGGTFQRTDTRPEIYLTISDQTDAREAKIYYIENMTTGFDVGYEGELFNGVSNPLAIYTHLVTDSEGKNYQVQSLPPNNFESMIIPVGVNVEAGTAITIDAATNNFPEGINIYLEDKQENIFTLLDTDSNFSTTLQSSLSGIGRFYLHTTSSVLSAADFDINTNISLYTSGNNNLRIVGVQKGAASVQMYNILGREVFKTSFEGNGVNDITLNTIPTGIYIVKLATENGTLNRKIIIQY